MSEMTNEQLYENLYEYVKNNFKDKNHELPFSPKTLYISSLSDNRVVNYEDIIDLDIVEFVRALYLNLFLRFPEEGIIEGLPKKFNNADEELRYKKEYLDNIILSYEAVSSGAKVIGYKVSTKKNLKVILRKIKQRVFGFIYNKIWLKTPQGFRGMIKKVVGRA